MCSMVTTDSRTVLHILDAKVAKRVILKSYLRKKFATMCGETAHSDHFSVCKYQVIMVYTWNNKMWHVNYTSKNLKNKYMKKL